MPNANGSGCATTCTCSSRIFVNTISGRLRVATGVEQKLTDGPFSILWFHVSADGTRILEQRAPTPLFEDLGRGETWITDAAGQNARQVTSNGIEEVDGELSPDNTQVLFTAEASPRLDPNYTWTLFTVPATGGTPTMTMPDLPYAIEHASWAPDSKTIFGLVNMGVHNEIFRIDVASHTAKPLTDGRHFVLGWSVNHSARRMVFQLDEPDRLGDGWTLPLEGGTPTRVTGCYDSLASRLRAAAPGEGHLEGRRWRRASKAFSSIRSATRPGNAIRSSCSCMAGRRSQTSLAAARACW